MASIAPSERLRRELDQIVAGVGDEHDPIEMIDRLRRPADPAVGARGRGDRLRELKARYRRILDEAGPAVEASAGLLALAADYRAAYPSAAAVIERELDALVCHLLPPRAPQADPQHQPARSDFVEVRRRAKVIGRFPRRNVGALARVGRARTLQPRMAQDHDDTAGGGRDPTAAAWPSQRARSIVNDRGR
jgi:hypothetical protein